MNNIETILGEYMQFVRSINFTDTTYQVKVNFGGKIKPIKDTSNIIDISSVDGEKGCYLYEVTKNIGLDKLATFIKKTINYNLEAIAKTKLYNTKIEELKQLFKEHQLEELQTLKFVLCYADSDEVQVQPTTDTAIDFTQELNNKELASENIVVEQPKVAQAEQKAEQLKLNTQPKEVKMDNMPSGKVNIIM